MNYGCKNGLPHDFQTLTDKETGQLCDFKTELWEICILCGKKMKWNKDPWGRIKNADYLDLHVRDFAQPGGRTGKVFDMLYGKPEQDLGKKGTNLKKR